MPLTAPLFNLNSSDFDKLYSDYFQIYENLEELMDESKINLKHQDLIDLGEVGVALKTLKDGKANDDSRSRAVTTIFDKQYLLEKVTVELEAEQGKDNDTILTVQALKKFNRAINPTYSDYINAGVMPRPSAPYLPENHTFVAETKISEEPIADIKVSAVEIIPAVTKLLAKVGKCKY